MAKKRAAKKSGPDLFAKVGGRRRRALILPRLLAAEADKMIYRGKEQDAAHEIIKHWVNLELEGHLEKKETALDAGFLLEIFGRALGYRTPTESPTAYELERNYYVPGIGTADGALGNFGPDNPDRVVAVIELKDKDADLDHDRFNGRTPVQQCWDYLNNLPECPWGIVSNFVTFRLYHRDKTQLAYQEFHLQELRKEETFRQFWCLFQRDGLLMSRAGQAPRALRLLEESQKTQQEVVTSSTTPTATIVSS